MNCVQVGTALLAVGLLLAAWGTGTGWGGFGAIGFPVDQSPPGGPIERIDYRNGVADYDTRNSSYYFNLGQCFGAPLAFLGAALALAGYAGRRPRGLMAAADLDPAPICLAGPARET